jgi:putative restriction endonuclease
MHMDTELIARITPDHAHRLAWFEDHQGQVSGPPEPLEPGKLRLVSTPKGIYKPADLPYSLSIKIKPGSSYADGVPVPTPGGGWLLSYHQEGDAELADRERLNTNRGLMRCIEDRIPVGVLIGRAPVGRRSFYDVLGLAMPVQWSEGRFFLESLDPPARLTSDPMTDVLEAAATAEVDQEAEDDTKTLSDDYDARRRVFRQIVARGGQSGFRAALLEAYRGRCAITGCEAPAALEGAHLRPYCGPESNNVTNGVLLRADIHTLFDLGLLAPDPVSRAVVVSKLLIGTQYEALAGTQLAEPMAARQRPNQEALELIWQRFHDSERTRNQTTSLEG